MTIEGPSASESGMLRRGSRTSPAVKVMLFQASAEKSDPVCDTQTATKRQNAVADDKPGTISSAWRVVRRFPKLSVKADGFQRWSLPYDSAPTTVSRPVTIQAPSSHPGLPMVRAMSADTMKMPDPIIAPMTTIVESYRPRPRTNSVSSVVADDVCVEAGIRCCNLP